MFSSSFPFAQTCLPYKLQVSLKHQYFEGCLITSQAKYPRRCICIILIMKPLVEL